MSRLMQRMTPGIVLTVIALAVTAAISSTTNLTLAWHQLALIALGICVVASVALALPPSTFRPLTSVGFDVSDIHVRTGEIERRTAHLDNGQRRSRFLWSLVPLTVAIVAVLVVSAV